MKVRDKQATELQTIRNRLGDLEWDLNELESRIESATQRTQNGVDTHDVLVALDDATWHLQDIRQEKCRTRDKHHEDYGTYRLLNRNTNMLVMSKRVDSYGLTLGENERYLGEQPSR